jgi:Cdc6-like AAA superfamily ATPase
MSDIAFTPSFGNRPTRLVGRDQIVRDFINALGPRPGSKNRALVILGQRGNGKTVLLWEFADRAREHGFVVATPTSVREGLLERIVEKISDDNSSVLRESNIRVSGGSVGALGISASLQLDRNDKDMSAEHKLTKLCRKLTDRGLGTLILVDELQANSPEIRSLVGTY